MLRQRLDLCLLLTSAAAAALVGCGEGQPGDESTQLVALEDDLVAPTRGKTDTGYLSSLATELEGSFESTLQLDLSDKSEEDRLAYIVGLEGGGYGLRSLTDKHIKYAKNQLNADKLHINLAGNDAELIESSWDEESGILSITYAVTMDTIVSFKELEAAGIDPTELASQTYGVSVPADPRSVFEASGETCAEGHDPGSLADYNLFYYFNPGKEGCSIPLVDGHFTIHSLSDDAQGVFPEYDRLVEDGVIEVVVFFGQAGHEDEVAYWDEGAREHREFVRDIEVRGFSATEGYEAGQRFVRERDGLEQVIDVVSPTDLKSLKEDRNGVFKEAVRSHEIVIYNGHSFYGSLSVLKEQDTWPEDRYQILFVNSCWSYEYYTEQVFRNKQTEIDPTGWDLADVVNDTESGWFLNMSEETRILLTNLLRGSESQGRDGDRYFTWANIIGAMNKHAVERFESWGLKSHEIYGVSGVRTNRFTVDD